jgi:hypothetical protein
MGRIIAGRVTPGFISIILLGEPARDHKWIIFAIERRINAFLSKCPLAQNHPTDLLGAI